MAERLGGKPALDATLPITGGKLVVRRLESGRIASIGLQLDELLQVEPDERLLARLEEEADELSALRRWLDALPAWTVGAQAGRRTRHDRRGGARLNPGRLRAYLPLRHGRRRMKLGILETGEVRPELKARHGDYPAMFEALLGAADPALEFATVRVVAGEMPASPGQADAWLVTGSRHGVYDGLPWIEPLKAFLRDCVGGAGAGRRHLLRPPDPRRGAGRPGREVGHAAGRSGCRTTR